MTTHPHFLHYLEQDLPALKSMVMALYAEDRAGETMTESKIEKTVSEFSKHPEKGGIVMFFMEGTVVGYAIISRCWSNEFGGNIGVLDEMFVQPQWRNQGIGSAFLDHLFSAAGKEWQGLQLEVTPDNHQALAFYQRHGFSPAPNQLLFKRKTSRNRKA